MQKILCLALGTVMLFLTLVGCGNTEKSAASSAASSSMVQAAVSTTADSSALALSGKITFSTNRTDIADTKLTALAKEFMDKNPNTEVSFEAIKDEKVIDIRMASNELNDITLVRPTVKMSDYPKYLTPLDDLGYNKDNYNTFENGVVDGKVYCLTDSIVYDGFCYNKAAFKAAGITSTPKTMEEFYAVSQKLKDAGIIPVALNFKDQWPLSWYHVSFANSNLNNPNYQTDISKTDLLLSDDNGFKTGFDFARTINAKGYAENDMMSTNWDASKADMSTSKIAMAYLGSWFPPQIVAGGAKPEDVGMFPAPGTKSIRVSYDKMYGVALTTKAPELAKAFLKYCIEEGRYPTLCDTTSPLTSIEPSASYVKELLDSGLPVMSTTIQSDNYNAILNKAQIDLNVVLQEYILSDKPEDVVKKYNDKYAAAKKTLGF